MNKYLNEQGSCIMNWELIDADERRFLYSDIHPPLPMFPDNMLHIGDIIYLGFTVKKWYNY